MPRPRRRAPLLPILLASLLGMGANGTGAQPVHFSEDAEALGLAFVNTDAESIAWLDYNGDGWQDLWLSAHWMWTRFYRSKLYLSQGGETFEDRWPTLHQGDFRTDAHASSWIDVDNDGDRDLFVVGGGQSGRDGEGDPNLLFLQENGQLREQGRTLGLANPSGRGRLAHWLDHNSDGLLDVLVSNVPRSDGLPSRNLLLTQGAAGTFAAATPLPGDLGEQRAGQLFMAAAPVPPWLAAPLAPAGEGLQLWLASTPRRVAVGDFGGDGKADYIVYTPVRIEREVCQVSGASNAMLGYIPPLEDPAQRVFSFQGEGPVAMHIDESPDLGHYLGSATAPETFKSRLLAPLNTEFHVAGEQAPPAGDGMRLSYDTRNARWQVAVQQPPERSNAQQFILEPLVPGAGIRSGIPACRYASPFRKHPAVIHDSAHGGRLPLAVAGLEVEMMPGALVPGDFNNDGHLDLYLERSTPHRDLPDFLLINDGLGSFQAHPVEADYAYAEHGLFLAGLIPGPHLAVADYNNDGRLDIFLASRYYYSGLENPRNMAGVPNRLLTNRGPGDHRKGGDKPHNWLKLDLVGSASNRDAIGAIVSITTGEHTQLRHQDGGADAYDQHMRTLHFGLGAAGRIDRLSVRWPSGQRSELLDLPVNKLLTVVEPEPASPVTAKEEETSTSG